MLVLSFELMRDFVFMRCNDVLNTLKLLSSCHLKLVNGIK